MKQEFYVFSDGDGSMPILESLGVGPLNCNKFTLVMKPNEDGEWEAKVEFDNKENDNDAQT